MKLKDTTNKRRNYNKKFISEVLEKFTIYFFIATIHLKSK